MIVLNHIKSVESLSDERIVDLIDNESPPLIVKARRDAKQKVGTFLAQDQVRLFLMKQNIYPNDDEVPVVAFGGNILDEKVLCESLSNLEPGRMTRGGALTRKAGGIVYFHDHYVSILRVSIGEGKCAYDFIDSMARSGEDFATRIRCMDIADVAIALRWHAFKKFSQSDLEYIDKEFTGLDAKDPRLFQIEVLEAVVGTASNRDSRSIDVKRPPASNGAIDPDKGISSGVGSSVDADISSGVSSGIASRVGSSVGAVVGSDVGSTVGSGVGSGIGSGAGYGDTSDGEELSLPKDPMDPTMTSSKLEAQKLLSVLEHEPSPTANNAPSLNDERPVTNRGKPAVECNFATGGTCRKNGVADGCTCGKCKRHCDCGAKEKRKLVEFARTPRAKRSNRSKVIEKIQVDAVNQTPAAMKEADPDYCSWKDFCALVPRGEEILSHLHDGFRISIQSSKSLWNKLTNYAIEHIMRLGRSVAHRNEVEEVPARLLREIRMGTVAKQQKTRIERSKDGVVQSLLKIEKEGSSLARKENLPRALLTKHFTPADLTTIQDHAGTPQEEHVEYGRVARKQGRLDYKKIVGEVEDVDLDYYFDVDNGQQMTRHIKDEVVNDCVGFIVENCSILSWGTRTVPSQNGGRTTVPNLTRMCTATEMHGKYIAKMEKLKLPFRRIVTHKSNLRPGHDEYKGSGTNLQVEWEDDTFTWESLYDFAKDDVATCAMYAFENDLLDQDGWKRLGKFVKDDGSPKRKPTLRAFRGGRKMVGRSTFFDCVTVLTGGGDKLVCSVDYVKGTLVHDVVETLQRIIDDHLKSNPEVHKELTRELQLLCNFLKNLYKDHIKDVNEDCVEWIPHSIQHALGVPLSSDRAKHYSMMDLDDLDKLLAERRIEIPKRRTAKARILLLMEDDYKKETQSDSGDLTTSSAGSDPNSSACSDPDELGASACKSPNDSDASTSSDPDKSDETSNDYVKDEDTYSEGKDSILSEEDEQLLDFRDKLHSRLAPMKACELRKEISRERCAFSSRYTEELRSFLIQHYMHKKLTELASVTVEKEREGEANPTEGDSVNDSTPRRTSSSTLDSQNHDQEALDDLLARLDDMEILELTAKVEQFELSVRSRRERPLREALRQYASTRTSHEQVESNLESGDDWDDCDLASANSYLVGLVETRADDPDGMPELAPRSDSDDEYMNGAEEEEEEEEDSEFTDLRDRTRTADTTTENDDGVIPALRPRPRPCSGTKFAEVETVEEDYEDSTEELTQSFGPQTGVDSDAINTVDGGNANEEHGGRSGGVDAKEDDGWCDGCAFMHYFMLEKLPSAINEVKRDEKNSDSLDNAIEYIADAHEKFYLYQAHVVRVVNQNRKLDKHMKTLRDLCCEEKNVVPKHLWHVIDFKMKWEAMYRRETTTKNYGKRGISWHGNRIHSYVWDEEQGKPVLVVVKLDQILEGWNKQDGMTVLALVEAAQVFVHREFPGASIEFLQSDNAGAYHLKELLLGIPLLNAVSLSS